MWLFTIYGFFSTSKYGDVLNVRARDRGHLEALKKRFPQLTGEVITLPQRDYLFRIEVPQAVWVDVVAELAKEQTWSNFKGAAQDFNGAGDYVNALHDVWEVMYNLQTTVSEKNPPNDRSGHFTWFPGDLTPGRG